MLIEQLLEERITKAARMPTVSAKYPRPRPKIAAAVTVSPDCNPFIIQCFNFHFIRYTPMGKGKGYNNKSCYFCEYKVLRGEYSLHRFPKEENINKQWKEFCNLGDCDDTRNLFLCSKHFKKSDFALLKAQQPGNGGARLIKNAVPSIKKAATPPPPDEENEPIRPVELEVKTDLPPDSFDIELSIPTQIVVRKDSNQSSTAELTNLASLLTNIQNFTTTPAGQPTQFLIQSNQAIFIPDSGTVFSVLPNQIQYTTTEAAAISTVPAELPPQIEFLSETEQAFADAQEFLQKETAPAVQTINTRKQIDKPRMRCLGGAEKAKKTIRFLKHVLAKRSRQLVDARETIRQLRKSMEFCKQVIADLEYQDVVSDNVAERLIEILQTYCCVLISYLVLDPYFIT